MRTVFLAAAALAGLALAAPAFAHDDDHRRDHRRMSAPVVVYDPFGRPIDPRYLPRYNNGRDRDAYRSPRWDGDDDDWDDERGRYGRRDRPDVIVIGGFFAPDLQWTYGGRRYVRYADWRGQGRWDRPFAIGKRLSHNSNYAPLPHQAYWRLPPAPYAYSYVGVGPDVLLVSPDGLVVDALIGLSIR